VVKDGESGVLITPFKVDEMVQEVICIASDQNRQNQLMQAAIKNARKFEINKVGKQWVEFFDNHLMER
jgi:glycosyltransferase involved in cell wall biosynthesis